MDAGCAGRTCHCCVCADAVSLHGCNQVPLKQARRRLRGTLTQRHLQHTSTVQLLTRSTPRSEASSRLLHASVRGPAR